MAARPLTLPELSLLAFMLRGQPQADSLLGLLPTAQVEEMADGGMGSLRFNSNNPNRRLGATVAQLWYRDEDDVPVLASLYLDTEGNLYELDSWKTDFTPLRRIRNF